MTRRKTRGSFILAGALAALIAAGCTGNLRPSGDIVPETAADAVLDVAGDVPGGDSGPFDVAGFCPSGSALTERGPLLPRPTAVYRWGEETPLVGIALEVRGAVAEDTAEIDALAEDLGLFPDYLEDAQAGSRGDGDAGPDGGQHKRAPVAARIRLHDAEDWTALLAACGLETGEAPGAYYLHADMADGVLDVHLFAGEDAGRFYGLRTLRQVAGVGPLPLGDARSGQAGKGRDVELFDRPVIGMRGLIEGFYGTPWTAEARLAMVEWAGTLRMTHYLYAPKAAPLINTAWMLPFEKLDLAHFKALAEAGSRNRVRICVEMHPSWMFHYSSPEDRSVLLGKFQAVMEQGVDCIVLAFDDVSDKLIPPDDTLYEDYTAAQVDLVPALGESLRQMNPELSLVYVPVEYYTNHPRAAEAWPRFDQALPDYWEIAWTGREIGNGAISLQDALDAAALLGRKPLLGDNYPVSDDANKTGVLFLGPLVGRSPDLLEGLSGVAFNAMPLPYSSLPALATAADYSWNPEGYEPAESMRNAARLLAGEEGAEALYTLAMANRCPMLEGSVAPELADAIAALWGALDEGTDPIGAGNALQEGFFSPYSKVVAGLAADGVLQGLAGETGPWAAKLAAYGDAGGLALTLLLEQADGKSPDPAQVKALADQAEALKGLLPRPTGGIMDQFLEDALAELGEL